MVSGLTDSDLTLAVLREIRDELKSTRTDLSGRLDAVRTELKAEIASVGARIDVTNERLALVEETLRDLVGRQVILTRCVANVVDRQDQAIDDIRERLVRLESRSEPIREAPAQR
jgi:chromosome segregation ATPase